MMKSILMFFVMMLSAPWFYVQECCSDDNDVLNVTWLGDPLPKKWMTQIGGMLKAEVRFYRNLGLTEPLDVTIHSFRDKENGYACMEEQYGVDYKWRSESGISVGGMYVPSQNLIGIFGFSKDSRHQLSTIYHEVSHGFVERLLFARRNPIWLNEGLAEYFGAGYIKRDGTFVHELSNYEKGAIETKFMLGEVKVDKFLDCSWKEFIDMELNDDRSAYRLAHAIVAFMIEKAPEGYFKELFNAIKGSDTAETSSQIVDRTYPGGVRAFEKGFRAFIFE